MSGLKFNYIDFLAVKPHLIIKNGKSLKTNFSTWLSLIIILLGTSSGIFFFISFLFKSQVYSNSSKGPFDYFPKTFLGKGSFEIFIGFEDPHYSYYDPKTILDLSLTQLTQRTINGKFTTEVKNISLQKCSDLYTADEILSRNLILPLKLFTCVNYTETSYIKNHWAQEDYSSLEFTFSICKNRTSNQNECQPIEVIEKMIQGGFISFFFSNNLVNPKNISSPIQYFIDQNYQILNFVGSTKINYNLNPIEFLSDEGVFLENIVTRKSFQAYPPIIFYEFKKSDIICSLLIDGASQGYTTFRFFPKIQDLFTIIGGTINCMIITGKLLMALLSQPIYLKHLQDHFIFNSQIYVDRKKSDSIDMKKFVEVREKRSDNSFINTKDLTKNSVIEFKPIDKNKEINHFSHIEKQKNQIKNNDSNITHLSLIDIFSSKIFFKNNKYNHLIVLQKIIDSSLSVESLISRYFEFELMKFFIFDDVKLEKIKNLLFNYINIQKDNKVPQNIQEYFEQKYLKKIKDSPINDISKEEKLNLIID